MDEAAREKIKTTRLGVLEILDYSCRYFWREAIVACVVWLIIYLPVNLLGVLIHFSVRWIMAQLALSAVYIVIVLLLALCTPALILWIARIVSTKCETGTVDWAGAAQGAFVLWPLELWTMFLKFLIIFGLLLLFIVPGIIWSLYYIFSVFVVAQGSLWGKDALDYSKALVKGQWWQTFGISFLISLILIVGMGLAWLAVMLVPTILWWHNPVVTAMNKTFFQMLTPFYIFPVAVWFTNLDYLHKRAAAVTTNAVPPG